MEQKNNECQYNKCHRAPLKDSKEGYCIFHAQRDDKDAQEFQAGIDQKIEDKDYNFTGFYFPKQIDFSNQIFGKEVFFLKAIFQGEANFEGAQFKEAYFEEAQFKEKAYFRKVQFKKWAYFRRAQFKERAFFRRAQFKEAYFEGAQFKEAYFENAHFEEAYFEEAQFKEKAYFRKVQFKKWAYFRRAQFKKAYFEEAQFGGAQFKEAWANFEEVQFKERAYFRKAQFKRWTDFRRVQFKEWVDFEGAQFENISFSLATFSHQTFLNPQATKTKIDFSRTMLENVSLTNLNLKLNASIDFTEARLFHSQLRKRNVEGHILQEKNKNFVEAKDIYVILKNNFHSLGNYDDESWAFRKEKEMERKSYFKNKRLGKWGWSKFLSLLYAYGEGPKRIGAWAILIIFSFAFLFLGFGIEKSPPGNLPKCNIAQEIWLGIQGEDLITRIHNVPWDHFLDCLYFSGVTFTTLGYGDFRPRAGWSRLISWIEAFIGALMMALFIFTFARRTAGR